MKNSFIKIWLIILAFGALNAHGQQFTEYEVKAAYVFNFTKFINWPDNTFDNPTSPYVLGIYGNDPFGSVLKKIIGTRKSNRRKWVVKYYSRPEQIQQCHILFVTDIKQSELRRLTMHLADKPVLTVGDEIDKFCQQGGIINFTAKKSPKRFEINNKAAKNAQLSISSKLLMLSKIITTDEIKF